MIDWMIAGSIFIAGAIGFAVMLRFTRKRGEDCPQYPYECPYCIHAAECMVIICKENRRRESVEK